MALSTQYNLDYLKKLIRGIYDNTLKEKETFYDKFVNIIETDDAYEIWDQDSGLGYWQLIEEDAPPMIDMPTKGGQKKLEVYKYGLGFAVTERMKRFDKWDRAAKLAKQLANKGRETIDLTVASILNNAFSSSYTGFDGQPLCSASHTILRTGATWSNTPASAVSIGLTAFQNALVHFATMLDDSGAPSPMKIAYLITHPANQIVVEEILRSQLQPYTADNTENIYKGLVKPIYNPYLTSQTAWFFVGPQDKGLIGDGHSLILLMCQEPMLKDWDDPGRGTTYFAAEGYWAVGFLHARGVYGHQGV